MGDNDTERSKLIEALQQVAVRDRAALHLVYDMTSAKLFGICLRICADREAAEDILQDVYIKVWKRADRFDATRASPITWLCTIARNSAIDWCRTTRRPTTLPQEAAEDIPDEARSADMLIEIEQDRRRLFDCLDQLDQQQNASIRAAFLDGLTYAQLADRMAVPLGTMKSWIRRGMQRLKECIGDG